MDGQERRSRDRRSSQKDYYTIVGILIYVGSLIFRIPLFYLIGEKGVGYFGIVYELYIVIGFFFAYGLSEATAVLIRYRIRREQFKNANKVLHIALWVGGIIGSIICFVLLFTSGFLAKKIMGLSLCGLVICVMAPAIIFYILTGVLKGYFQGNGSRVPSVHSKIIELVVLFVSGLIGAYVAYEYGEKVSALLLNESYAPAYGAVGACMGIFISSVLCFLHMLLLYFIYRRRAKKQEYREQQKYSEKSIYVARILSGTAVPYAATGLIFHCLPFISGCLYMNLSADAHDSVAQWGCYYGKYLVVIGGISALISMMGIEPVRRIIYWTEHEEYRAAKEKITIMFHQIMMWTIAAAVFIAVLSENILNLFFKGNNIITATWIMWGSITIVFYVLSLVFANMLMRLRKLGQVLIYTGISLAGTVIMIYILLVNTGLGVLSLVIGNVIFYGAIAITGFVLLCKGFQYKQEWIRSVAFPIVAAGISGLIVMLLNKVFESVLGSTISMFISLPVGIAAYMFLLLAIRCVNERELENMFMGRLLINVGRMLHLL